MEINEQTAQKILTELERIANAVEVLALHADERFIPRAEWIMQWKREDNQKRSRQP